MKFRLCPITPFLFLFTVCFAGGTALAAEEVVPPNRLPNCVVSLIDEAQVPAQEAGVIVELKVSAGMNVEKGDLLAQIDDAKPQMEYRVAAAKLAVAKEKSTDDINVRYAIASAKVAEAAYNTADDANRRVPGSVPKTEMQSLWLKHKESTLGIEKAQLEQRIAVQETRRGAGRDGRRRGKHPPPQDPFAPDRAWSANWNAMPANGCSRAIRWCI